MFFFRNIYKYVPDNKVPYPKRQQALSMVGAIRTSNLTQRNILLHSTSVVKSITVATRSRGVLSSTTRGSNPM
jgi:hypothetical protein